MVASLHPHACPAEEVLELTDITEVGGSDTLSKSGAHSGGLAASAVLTRQFPACRSLILTTFGPPASSAAPWTPAPTASS